ncbi:MAG TPA: hypothetical protein VFJ82_00710 [Longimicrobium sp.]|nr:hypothetical protein [Longimicrobium sp.]
MKRGAGWLLLACMLGGALAWRQTESARVRRPGTAAGQNAAPAGLSDSASVWVNGRLTPAADRGVREIASNADAVLIVLRDRDRRVCEDLGRQLRELLRQTGAGTPAIVLVDSASADAYRTYLHREHVRASLMVIAPDDVLTAHPWVPTPAVLIRHGGAAVGVAHPIRFPNLRLWSFATELKPLLH